MTRTIWKFRLEVNSLNKISIPKGGKVMSLQTQHEEPTMWVMNGSLVFHVFESPLPDA